MGVHFPFKRLVVVSFVMLFFNATDSFAEQPSVHTVKELLEEFDPVFLELTTNNWEGHGILILIGEQGEFVRCSKRFNRLTGCNRGKLSNSETDELFESIRESGSWRQRYKNSRKAHRRKDVLTYNLNLSPNGSAKTIRRLNAFKRKLKLEKENLQSHRHAASAKRRIRILKEKIHSLEKKITGSSKKIQVSKSADIPLSLAKLIVLVDYLTKKKI